MVLSKAAPPRIAAPRRPVGRPETATTRAIEAFAVGAETSESWGRVLHLSRRIHLAVVADRPDVVEQSAGELVYLAGRRLRQLSGGDA